MQRVQIYNMYMYKYYDLYKCVNKFCDHEPVRQRTSVSRPLNYARTINEIHLHVSNNINSDRTYIYVVPLSISTIHAY